MKKTSIAILATATLLSTHAVAQTQAQQEACSNDVYTLCGEDIPDRDRIAACLRKHWSRVSHKCRSVLANYNRHHHAHRHHARHHRRHARHYSNQY